MSRKKELKQKMDNLLERQNSKTRIETKNKQKRKSKPEFYSLNRILKYDATYNIIIGERSNGKTYAALEYGLRQYINSNYVNEMAIIRRWQDDLTGARASSLFNAHVSNGLIKQLTNGEWTDVYYWSRKFWLCRYEGENRIKDTKPFCYIFAISTGEHDKSTSYPNITTIVFDEFLTRNFYIPDEFVHFQNVLSTIIRHRGNVKIFMLGNTVNKYCPYFNEMGLIHIKEQEQGTIDIYTYGESTLKVAVEYCESLNKSKESNKYFAFDNSKLQMITHGTWEIDIYPHVPCKYAPNEIMLSYFILFDEQILQCDIVYHYEEESDEQYYFTYIHRKTGEIKDKTKDIIYCPEFSPRENWGRSLLNPTNSLQKKILSHFKREKVFYQDNEVGEVIFNYLKWCVSDRKIGKN